MSGHCTIWAWKQEVANSTHRLVLLALADIASDSGKLWAGHEHIADKTNLSPRTVRSAMGALRDQGLIRSEPRAGRSDITYMCMSRFEIDPPTDDGEDVRPRGRPKKTPATGDEPRQAGARPLPPVADEPSNEPSIEPSPSNEGCKTSVRAAFEAYCELADKHGLTKPMKINPARKAKIKSAIKEAGGLEGVLRLIADIENSDFLMGRTNGPRGPFSISFDWIMSAPNFLKLMEGNFHRNRINGSANATRPYDPTSARNHSRTSAMFAGAALAVRGLAPRDGGGGG